MSLAEALIAENQLAEANEILTKVSKNTQPTARLQKIWGDLYKNQGLYQEATEAYQSAKLLSAEDVSEISEFQDLELSKELDDSEWKELAESYSAEAESKFEASSPKL
jgi:predicted negative regulator of RcsB-dependent stress response